MSTFICIAFASCCTHFSKIQLNVNFCRKYQPWSFQFIDHTLEYYHRERCPSYTELVQSRRSKALSRAQRTRRKTEQGRICQLHLFNCFCHLSHGFACSAAERQLFSFRLPLPSSHWDTSPPGPGSPPGLWVSPWPRIPVTHHHHHCNNPTHSQMFFSLRARSSPRAAGVPQAGKSPLEPGCCPDFLQEREKARVCQAGSPVRLPRGCWASLTRRAWGRALNTSLAGRSRYYYIIYGYT